MMHTTEAAFDLAMIHGMPWAGHSHPARALCAVVAECCLLLWKSPQTGKTATPQTTCPGLLQPAVQAPPHLMQTEEAAFDLAVSHDIPLAGHSHTGRALCAVVAECCLLLWKSAQTGKKKYNPHKPPAQPCRSPWRRPHHTSCTLRRLCFI